MRHGGPVGRRVKIIHEINHSGGEGTIDEHLEVGLALRAVIGAGAEVRQGIARRMSLSEHELVTLEHLADGARGSGELARLVGVSPAATTGIVDRLAERGHVERAPGTTDRRRVEVHLTASGRQAVYAELQPMFDALRAAHADLDDHEREAVLRYLAAAAHALHDSGLTRSGTRRGER